MASKAKVDVISRKAIKPSSPTPPHLRTLKLSLLDQFFSPTYGYLIFFYNTGAEKSTSLQKSLSETLVRFYPMAGRLRPPAPAAAIECNDEGAVFIEARIGFSLEGFLTQPDAEMLNRFIPTNDPNNINAAPGCVLFVQLTVFTCGGLAICVCTSHAIADASSLQTLVRGWAAASCGCGDALIPIFIGDSVLPPSDSPLTISYPPRNILTEKSVTKRFVFPRSRIDHLKAKLGGAARISKVATVLALIVNRATAASRSLKTPALFQLVDLRKKMSPPLPENSIGNPILMYAVVFEDPGMELSGMVAKMREGLAELIEEKARKIRGREGPVVVTESLRKRADLMKNKELNIYKSSSACRVPVYDIDFGWGEPVWVTTLIYFSNQIVLMDTKRDGGIEAWVTLEEKEMAVFERDEELLHFASLNPSAFIPYSRI